MSKLTSIIRALALGCCSFTLALIVAAPVLAIEDGGIGGKPANPRKDNPRSESIFVYELQPGANVQDAVQVINNTDVEKTLQVYAVDSQVASEGAFTCAQKIDQPVSVGSWIKVSKAEVTLAPHSFENVPFSINVPQSASAGESNGCLVVQDAKRASSGNTGISLSFRTAIRVSITIPGAITKDLSFTGLAYKKISPDTLRFSVGLKNNGNVSLDSDLKVQLKTLFGNTVKTAGGVFPVLNASEAVFNFEVDEPFWGGWYKAAATASYNPDADKSVGESGSVKTITGPEIVIFTPPKPAAMLIEITVALVALALGGWLIWRNVHLNRLRNNAHRYTVKHGDTLHKVASNHNVKWQTIARVNKIKPPYHLEPGQHLDIPKK